MSDPKFYVLDAEHTDPARLKREREKARELKKSSWWLTLRQKGVCHHCGQTFKPAQITMDHLVPLARGGTSTKGNIVPSCGPCNAEKKLESPVDQAFEALERERKRKESDE